MRNDVATSEYTPTSRDSAHDQLLYLMDRYEGPLFNFLLVLTGDRALAEDSLQQVFLQLFEHLCKAKPVNATWLYRVARSRAVDSLRDRARSISIDEQAAAARLGEVHEDDSAVRHALSQLTAEDREILYLFDVDAFSAAEIGRMLGIRAGAVRTRVCRARARFRTIYRQREE